MWCINLEEITGNKSWDGKESGRCFLLPAFFFLFLSNGFIVPWRLGLRGSSQLLVSVNPPKFPQAYHWWLVMYKFTFSRNLSVAYDSRLGCFFGFGLFSAFDCSSCLVTSMIVVGRTFGSIETRHENKFVGFANRIGPIYSSQYLLFCLVDFLTKELIALLVLAL